MHLFTNNFSTTSLNDHIASKLHDNVQRILWVLMLIQGWMWFFAEIELNGNVNDWILLKNENKAIIW